MIEKEKKLSEEIIYNGKVVKLTKDIVECANGKKAIREIIHHNGGSAVLCINNQQQVLLIKQFRYAYNEVIYEIPAGKIELNEDPKLTALRELEEEAGIKANKIEFLNVIYPTCGYSNEKIYLYYTDDFVFTKCHFDEDEYVEADFYDIEEVYKMIDEGKINDSKIICALFQYVIRKNTIL